MSRGALKAACTALALAFVLALPAHALAATAPAAGGTLDLQAWPENGNLVVVVAITVPPTTKLPAKVRIPVPAIAKIQWAGEILGGDPSADPSRSYKIIKSPVGGQYAEFTLETTRAAQVDSFLPVLTTNGSNVSAAFDWIQSAASPFTTFSLRVPVGATNVSIRPQPVGAPETNAAGEALYSGDPLQLKPGSTTKVSLAYTTGAAVPGPAAPARGASALYFVISALVVTAAILVVVLVKRRSPSA